MSPYTKSAGNVDAKIMVMLQDWTSDDFISGPVDLRMLRLGYSEGLATNRNLIRLLKDYFNLSLNEIFATNLFPFIKPGNMGQRIRPRDLLRAAGEFALPQMRIVQPKLVICLGLQTYNAMREACGEARTARLLEAISGPFTFEGARVASRVRRATSAARPKTDPLPFNP